VILSTVFLLVGVKPPSSPNNGSTTFWASEFTVCASNTDICCAVDHCLRSARVAVVEPVFTTTAYSSFYSFYSKYAHTPMGVLIKKDLGLLNTTLREGWGFSSSLYSFVTSSLAKRAGLSVGNNTWIISDVDVNNGELFNSRGGRNFDVVILGFTEYVTLKEYLAYKHFVASGGHILVLSACNFLAEVSYNPLTKRVSLVEGHGWVFNGTAAWRGVYARWYTDNTDWVGSNYALYSARGYTISGAVANTTHPLSVFLRTRFSTLLFNDYAPHEENIITNSSDLVIAYWRLSYSKHPDWVVAIYEHRYQRGSLIHLGVFGTDILSQDKALQYFVLASIYYFTNYPHSYTI